MDEQWSMTGPKVLDIGDEGEQVRRLKVELIGGRVDIVTHDDSPTARIEVLEVCGPEPLTVTWQDGKLNVRHGQPGAGGLLAWVKNVTGVGGRLHAKVSVSIPATVVAQITTVEAAVLVNGLHQSTTVNTVGGEVTLADQDGTCKVNTVSGSLIAARIAGDLDVSTVAGDITVEDSRLAELSTNTVSGTVVADLDGPPAKISVNTVSGDVTVRIAGLRGYDARGNSVSGQIVIDGHRLGGKASDGGRVSEGDGELRIRANTVSASVVVLRSDADQSETDRTETDRTDDIASDGMPS